MSKSLQPDDLAWLRQCAAVDGNTYDRLLLHLLERVESLEARPIPGAVELVPSTPEAAPAQPEGEGLSLAEVDELCAEFDFHLDDDRGEGLEILQEMIGAALARWGRPTAPPAPEHAVGSINDEQREAVRAAVAQALGDACDCHRAWEAWEAGTMGPDDFVFVSTDDYRVAKIADAAIEAICPTASQAPEDLATDQMMAANLSALLIKECGLHSPGSSAHDLLQRAAAMLVNYGLPAHFATSPALEVGEGPKLRAALQRITAHRPIMGSTGDYRQGQLDILKSVQTIATTALETPAAPPAPEVAEVAELVVALELDADRGDEFYDMCNTTAEQFARAAELLQQQQHLLGLAGAELDRMMEQQEAPAPAVVPVAVKALTRLYWWGGMSGSNGYNADVVLGVRDWINGGMAGDLPPLPALVADRCPPLPQAGEAGA